MHVSLSEAVLAPPPPVSPAGPTESASSGPSFAAVLEGLGHEIDRGENTMRAAIGELGSSGGGADLAPSELISLQMGVYRYSDAIDVASRLVDRTTSAVKTVLQGSGP
jgi:hypothetical protein